MGIGSRTLSVGTDSADVSLMGWTLGLLPGFKRYMKWLDNKSLLWNSALFPMTF